MYVSIDCERIREESLVLGLAIPGCVEVVEVNNVFAKRDDRNYTKKTIHG